MNPLKATTAIAVVAGIGAGFAASRWRDAAPATQSTVPGNVPTTTSEPSGDAPRIELAEPRVSFGTKFDDEEPEVVIAFRNAGGATLHVARVETSCGCMRAGETPTVVEPGRSAEVRIKIRLVGMSGPVSRVVAIHTDDPKTAAAHVSVAGEVRPRLEAEPSRIELVPETGESGASADIDVRSNDGTPLSALTVSTGTQALTVSAKATDATARVHVETGPFTQDFLGSIVLHLGKYERVLIVNASAARDVRVSPDRLTAGVVRRAQTLEARLVARKGLAWRVASVEPSRKDLTAEFSDGMLRVRIEDTAPAGAFVGYVTIVLEGAKPDRLRVPVTAYVER